MRGISFSASKQDPIFGISHSNIVPDLTPQNWRNKAIVRDGIYLWVARGSTRNGSGQEVWRYCVRTHGYNDRKWNKEFAKRDAALTYANRLSEAEGSHPVESQNKYVIS